MARQEHSGVKYSAMNNYIEARDIHGEKHLINGELLQPRKASYGFIVSRGKLLVQDNRKVTGKYWLVGGQREAGETPEETVIREAMEETGEEIQVRDQIYEHEYNFIMGAGKHYHCEVDYYDCVGQGKVATPIESAPLAWLPIAEISPMSFHILIQDAVRAFLVSQT